LEDFRETLESIAMATKWDEETISAWEEKGKNICGSVLEKRAWL
jgi:hypothetical protein